MTAAVQYPPSAYSGPALTPRLRGEERVAAAFARQQQPQTQEPGEQIIDAEWQPVHEPVFYPGPNLEATPVKLFFSAEEPAATVSAATVAARYQQMESESGAKKIRANGQKLDIFI
jgi:hypothetical protein